MNIEKDDLDLLNGSPDPAWDYYVLWHRIQQIKAQLDRALIWISQVENQNTATDKETAVLLRKPWDRLDEILNGLPDDDDEPA
ncbi:MAG: hypothetical protein HWQ41_19375 [Nostoc sp. NOS(2021)]|uniref:hypothetical protein n=1 Tax=Nostoc sp. NOS(2021) TaxID=2815407 RepID=UPI0025E21346|nr:hypothetical protein [Nostoc sp. NOS(2021)]MBN3897357.1 hypothetical protein [Nostoc sp. NOS(2021)]